MWRRSSASSTCARRASGEARTGGAGDGQGAGASGRVGGQGGMHSEWDETAPCASKGGLRIARIVSSWSWLQGCIPCARCRACPGVSVGLRPASPPLLPRPRRAFSVRNTLGCETAAAKQHASHTTHTTHTRARTRAGTHTTHTNTRARVFRSPPLVLPRVRSVPRRMFPWA